MPERVIAVDPGGRTGYAYGNMDVDRLELKGWGVLPQRDFARWLADRQRLRSPTFRPASDLMRLVPDFDVIVSESWRPRPKNGSMAWIQGDPLLSAQHVGQIRLIADLSGARYTELQPSDKHVWVASMPPQFHDLDAKSSEQHDQDARWHFWGYFFRNWFSGEGAVVQVKV